MSFPVNKSYRQPKSAAHPGRQAGHQLPSTPTDIYTRTGQNSTRWLHAADATSLAHLWSRYPYATTTCRQNGRTGEGLTQLLAWACFAMHIYRQQPPGIHERDPIRQETVWDMITHPPAVSQSQQSSPPQPRWAHPHLRLLGFLELSARRQCWVAHY